MSEQRKHRILVADDEAANVALVRAHLEGDAMEVFGASNGAEALRVAEAHPPDLVVLDVVMPDVDGYGALQALKLRAQASGEYLPVVLVTALSDRESRRKGWRLGADEFLTKPIDATELRLRVDNLLALRHERTLLRAQNARLVQLQQFKDEMSTLLVHDLRNPAAAVLGNVDFALADDHDATTRREALVDARDGGRRLLRLLANLLDVAKAEDHRLELHAAPVALASVINPIVNLRHHACEYREITLQSEIHTDIVAPIDEDLVARIVENVLDNAFRYTPRGGTISLTARMSEGQLQIRIGNSGAPIPVEQRDLLFEKYVHGSSTAVAHSSSGLGLYFCKIAAEAHGGRIWVEEEASYPTVFVLALPTHHPRSVVS